MQNLTEFRESYLGHQPLPVEPFKREYVGPDGIMENRTSYNTEFIEHGLIPAQVEAQYAGIDIDHSRVKIAQPHQAFSSEYRETFKGEAPRSSEPQVPLPVLEKPKFDGTSTHQKDYQAKTLPTVTDHETSLPQFE